MFTKINPVGERVVIKPQEAAKVSASGLVQEHTQSNVASAKVLGLIVEASPESKFKDLVGRKVFFRRYSMDELKYIDANGEQTVVLIDDSEVLATPTEA